jgi:S1-C subfamily serine protease
MKKFLGIIILGLLLSGCTTARQEISKGGIDPGISKNQLKRQLEATALSEDPFLGGCYRQYYPNLRLEVLSSRSRSVYFIFEKVYESSVGCSRSLVGDGRLAKITYSRHDVETYIDAKKPKTTTKKTTTKKTTTKKTTEKKVAASSGSAFFVSNTGYIITNFHVIETCNDNSKIFYKTNKIDTKLIAKDEYLDLALLKAEVSNNKFIRISNKAPRKLQRIIAAGYPFGKYLSDDMKFTSGIVSSLKGIKNDSTRLQIDAALNPGNSGGPIVDENTGELVAVAVAGLRKDITESVNYGIKSASVKNFLESNQIDPSTFSIKFGIGNIAEHLENTVLYTFCN